MASRFFGGSKASKQKVRSEEEGLASKRSSIPAPPRPKPGPSSQPTSSLPRSKATSRPEKKTSKSAPVKTVEPSRTVSLRDQRKTTAAIPRGVERGMGTHTMITSIPAAPSRNRLRRKASSVDQRSRYTQSEGSESTYEPVSHNASDGYTDPFPGSILGISMPETNMDERQRLTTPTEHATSNSRMASYVSKQPHKISTTDLPPPTPNFASRSSGSSRYSDSPGPFSRTSTPTSASSQSPGMLQAPKLSQLRNRPSASPTRSRPPVTRRKITGPHEESTESQGLPALRESQTSSSSSSTVKGTDIVELVDGRVAARAHKNQTPPTPPLRLSSKRGRDPLPAQGSSSNSESRSGKELRQPVFTSRLAKPSQSSTSSATSQPQASSSSAASRSQASNSSRPQISSSSRPQISGSSTASKSQVPGSSVASKSQIPSSSAASKSSRAKTTTLPRPSLPPTRPSREDVPPLHSESQAVIVKSNLAHLATTGHKRKDSADRILDSPLKIEKDNNLSKLSRTSSITSTKDSNKRASITSPHLHQVGKKEPKGNTFEDPLSSASPSKSSRFGLFTRRIKSPSETSITSPDKQDRQEKQEKLTKKGPAAGTGHEGYSKYARRGRSGSTSTAASRGRSISTDRHSQILAPPSRKSSFGSQVSKPELDDFYKERLEPVVIGGGGRIRENRNSQASLYQMPSGQTSAASVDTNSYATSKGRATDTSAGPSSVTSSQRVSRELLPAPILTSSKMPEQRTLAHRRSLHRSQLFGEDETVRIPPPINTKVLAPSPLISTYDSTMSSAPRTDASDDVSEGHEGNWLKPKKKRGEKSRLTRKWNFFQRTKSPEKGVPQSNDDEVQASPQDYEGPSIGHYAMMDDAGPEDDQDLEERLRNIEGHLRIEDLGSNNTNLGVDTNRQVSMLLPSPPKFPAKFETSQRSASPKVSLNQSPPKVETTEATEHARQPSAQITRRPSRLQQVGRIPRVVSKRDRRHNPAPQSFSRPFNRPSVDESGSKSATERPTLALQTDMSTATSWNPFAKPASAPVNNMLYNLGDEQEFLRFNQRKDSEVSGSSGSSKSGILSLAPMTAAPAAQGSLGEDEVWYEFDELLDDVGQGLPSLDSPELESMIASFPSLSNIRSPQAAARESLIISDGSSETARAASPAANRSSDVQPIESHPANSPLAQASNLPLTQPPNLPLPQPPTLISTAEPSPVSLSEFYANYGDRSSATSNARHSTTSIESGSRYSSQTMISRSGSRSSVESDQTKRVTQVMAEKTNSHHSHSLRFSALMTSRWLSFDKVLFSPAQEEVLTNKQNRVLILDGLQNDDWSAFCALTYPETMVYNLASFSKKRESVETTNSESWTAPPNLRRVSHASIAAPFPFPKGFFTAVVFRFPAASPSYAYRNAISECKRVLRPGGYLELTMLDMDMVNMGALARRAVRGVKERIAQMAPEVSLVPISDTVMKMLGRRGFENLNRCVVGVPIAGSVTGNHQAGFDKQAGQASSSASASVTTEGSSSLMKLLAGRQGTTDNTYAGPMMIARVGRWWWSRCYEKGVLGEQAETIWQDKALVKECEKKKTGLRLVVCYAQKPESPRRRTVSV